jgi:hypothetical protein
VHAALSGQAWWLSLAATAAGCLAVYAVLLPTVLPAGERAQLAAPVARLRRGSGI